MRTETVSRRARAVDIGSSSSFGFLVPVLSARAGYETTSIFGPGNRADSHLLSCNQIAVFSPSVLILFFGEIAIELRGYVVTGRPKSADDSASAGKQLVFVIDDDEAIRVTLSSLFRSMGLQVELFASAREFAQIKIPDIASCLVLDIRLPGVSGLDFQAELAEADIRIPIIFMTGHGDIPMSVKAMKAGAIDFLTKPFRDQDILDAVIRALERDQKRRDSEKAVSQLRILFDSLTPREREVMTFVAEGLMNKQIAAKLGITEITVKVHRGHMMQKMKARSLIDLLEMADLLGIRRPKR
jgi:FixJ family two-component response regulator